MTCIPLLPATCVLDGAAQAAGSAASGVIGNSFANAMRDGAAWVIKTTIAWWIEVPAVDLTRSPVDAIRGYVQFLAVVIAVAGIIWQGVLLTLSRKPQPLINVGRGLFYLALWTSIGVIGPAAALDAGDSFSTWVLDQAAGGQATDRLVRLADLSGITSGGAVILLGLLMMLAGLVQAVLMLFREGAVVVLAGVVVLAAAGSFSQATRPWLPRVVGWMLALICYKPAAALVYAAALALVGQGSDPRTIVVGLSMMILAIIALPVLMKFFTWTTGAATSNGGGLAAIAGASAAAMHAAAVMQSAPGRSASGQASHIRSDLGPSSGPSSTPAGASTATPPQTAASPVPPTGGAASTPSTTTASTTGAAAGSTAGTGAASTAGTAAASTGTAAASTAGTAAAGPVGAATAATQAGTAAAKGAARRAGGAMTEDGDR